MQTRHFRLVALGRIWGRELEMLARKLEDWPWTLERHGMHARQVPGSVNLQIGKEIMIESLETRSSLKLRGLHISQK